MLRTRCRLGSCEERERSAVAGSGAAAGERGRRVAQRGQGERCGAGWQSGQRRGPGLRGVLAPAQPCPWPRALSAGVWRAAFEESPPHLRSPTRPAGTAAAARPRRARTTGKGCPSRGSKGTWRTTDQHTGKNRCRFPPRAPVPTHRICPWRGIGHRSARSAPESGCSGLRAESRGLRLRCCVLQPGRALGNLWSPGTKTETVSPAGFTAEVLLLRFVIYFLALADAGDAVGSPSICMFNEDA